MILKLVYFKLRGRFNFSPHPYEIGRPVIQNKAFADNYFCLKLYELNETEYSAFYTYQLNHFLKTNPGKEEEFFDHVQDIVSTRINYFKQQNPFSPKYASHAEVIPELRAFQASFSISDIGN